MKNRALTRSPARLGVFRFGVFEFNTQTGELRKHGLKIKLEPQTLKVLSLLLERPGQICRREELKQRLWPDNIFVDFEHSLYKAIHTVRQALGDSATNPRFIETIEGQGYRFIPIPQELIRPAVRPRSGRKIDSLAVLPFANGSAESEMDFLTKRISERIIDVLSRMPGIGVLAYCRVQHFRQKDLDPWEVGQILGVRAVARGEMIRHNDEVLLHVELIDVGSGIQLWGEQFREPYSDVLEHPEKVADKISYQLRPILSPDLSRSWSGRTESEPKSAA
jgi:DNA-binding winged helix-turn-helix (wHTH) protein